MQDKYISSYVNKLTGAMSMPAMAMVGILGDALINAWQQKKTIYLCGNGGSAANAMHIAHDLIYGAGVKNNGGIRVEALTANSAVLTCLANDIGYESIFAEQLKVKANAGDILIALSGSGNSKNIVKALEVANQLDMETFAILGYAGGLCKTRAKYPIHFAIDDMQVSEDLQLIVGHICMQWLCDQKVDQG